MDYNTTFRHFGTMIDCSRNAVMSVPSVKRWIDLTSDLGYNTLMLYTEDTYESMEHGFKGKKLNITIKGDSFSLLIQCEKSK